MDMTQVMKTKRGKMKVVMMMKKRRNKSSPKRKRRKKQSWKKCEKKNAYDRERNS
jgi:hypothetical protein